MKPGDFVIWTDRVGEIVTVYNDGLNLVIKAENQKAPTAKKVLSPLISMKSLLYLPMTPQ
jgi:hypothetical protein